MTMVPVARLEELRPLSGRCVKTGAGEIAVFRTADDRVFALYNRCPHRGGPLSEGIVHGHSVTCPLHNLVVSLATGAAEGPDEGCAATIACELRDGIIHIDLPAHALGAASPSEAA